MKYVFGNWSACWSRIVPKLLLTAITMSTSGARVWIARVRCWSVARFSSVETSLNLPGFCLIACRMPSYAAWLKDLSFFGPISAAPILSVSWVRPDAPHANTPATTTTAVTAARAARRFVKILILDLPLSTLVTRSRHPGYERFERHGLKSLQTLSAPRHRMSTSMGRGPGARVRFRTERDGVRRSTRPRGRQPSRIRGFSTFLEWFFKGENPHRRDGYHPPSQPAARMGTLPPT